MTKFDELCTTYRTSCEPHIEYRRNVLDFANDLIRRYKKFLGVPCDFFRVVPADETPNPDTKYTTLSAIHLNDDMYWHFGLQLTLDPNEYPQHSVLIVFRFKQIEDHRYQLKISEQDAGHEITCGNDSEFSKFFEFLQGQIIAHIKKNSPQEFLINPANP